MKDAMHRSGSVVAARREGPRRFRRRPATCCSICSRRVWFRPVRLSEPDGVPEPRLSWVLCRQCYGLLLEEMERSPVRSPLRLRIAMGIVASERWSEAYPTQSRGYLSDRRWIIFMAVGFFVALILHLVLIVMVASGR
ncbi:hypothetical protein EPA93_36645 [Ktedonosporobacter rubrisoli]|uniref:Uncharacterized protein n=1 Tax=Ktedonosporobacter rubrisoli TaxID=2509675 RepID=A0A4V0YZX2_KTERU|nr:hypothetical protein [Ktedonosporobacter rubrisoli]QBD81211.1 hypothetical protein EPA93_36645 [Ktedonosporobacter rubrisoli]